MALPVGVGGGGTGASIEEPRIARGACDGPWVVGGSYSSRSPIALCPRSHSSAAHAACPDLRQRHGDDAPARLCNSQCAWGWPNGRMVRTMHLKHPVQNMKADCAINHRHSTYPRWVPSGGHGRHHHPAVTHQNHTCLLVFRAQLGHSHWGQCNYNECPRALLYLVYCAGRAQSCFLTILRIPSALLTCLAPASCTLHPEFYTT